MKHGPDLYRCPVCQSPLSQQDRSLTCARGHSFDIAKQGYVNLLLAHEKKSLQPGDSKTMVQARRSFLEQGHYQALSDSVAELLAENLDTSQPLQLLDTGCGEGYYTKRIADALSERCGLNAPYFWGVDISKPAIQSAAKKDSNLQFSVASSAHLPFSEESFHAAVKIYAPSPEHELHRVLKPKGLLIAVNPGPHHLHQLKALVYKSVKGHTGIQTPEGFENTGSVQLRYNISLRMQQDIQNLLLMTPFYWSASKETQAKIASLDHLDIDTDFDIRLFRKKAARPSSRATQLPRP